MKIRNLKKILLIFMIVFAVGLGIGSYFLFHNEQSIMKESFIDNKILKNYGLDNLEVPNQTHQLSWNDRYTCKVESEEYYFSYVHNVFNYLNANEQIESTYFLIDQSYAQETELRNVHRMFLYHSNDVYDYYVNSYELDNSSNSHNFNFYYSLKNDYLNVYKLSLSFEYSSFGEFWEKYGVENTLTIYLNKYEFFYLDSFKQENNRRFTRYENYIVLLDSDVEEVKITKDNFNEYFTFNNSLIKNNGSLSISVDIENVNKSYCNAMFKIDALYGNNTKSSIIRPNNWFATIKFTFEEVDASSIYSVNIDLFQEGYLYFYSFM